MPPKVLLTEYFQAVDRYLERENRMPEFGFRVNIRGHLIEMRFPTEQAAQNGRISIEGFLSEETRTPDATFLYWHDQCDAFLPEGESLHSSVWTSSDHTGNFRIGTDDNSLTGCDYTRQRYYFSRPEKTASVYLNCRHAMVNAFSRWAQANDMLLFHAAAVGTAGKGVLVAGRGGSGKSTFAVSCLAEGLDYVSDDYTLLSASGPLRAMPLYSIAALREDMISKIPGLPKPLLEESGGYLGGKPQFHVPSDRLKDALDIQAIVIPKIGGEQAPSIVPTQAGRVITQMVYSTITQVESRRDSGLILQMTRRLSGLPVYEFSMSTDLKENPAFLRSFIEKEF